MTSTLLSPKTQQQLLQLPPGRPRREPLKVALLSTYPPRQCGLAFHTAQLYRSLVEVAPDLDVRVCAVDRERRRYGNEVIAVLDQNDPASYRKTAGTLAATGVEAVLIQHEFGIYGGADGAWIAFFTAELAAAGIPYVATLHTLLSTPSRRHTVVLRRLCRDAAAVIVLSPASWQLAATSGIQPERFVTVPRGAPEGSRAPDRRERAARVRPELTAVLEEFANHTLVSSFGLLSPNKGLHTAITAVAELAEELPDLRYIIAGATHPEIVRRHGERYRHSLVELVAELGAGEHVRFLDFFLTEAEVAELLSHTTAFLTPYRSRDQAGSGTLSFALAAGCPVVSTSFFYAEDMLAAGAGLLAEPGDTEAYTAALRRMLTEAGHLARAERAARMAGAELHWPIVARRIADVIRNAAGHRDRLLISGGDEADSPPRFPLPR